MAWPHFISACQLLVKSDITLWIDTNLSIESRVREFAEKIPAAMVENLYISLHITERERHKQIDTFIKLMALLQNKGYKTQVNYVMDPRLLHRFAKDSEFFKTHGIELMAKPYKGVHRLKLYPESYTKGERRTILDSSPDAFRRTIFYPHGARCDAGRSLVRLLPDGTVTRCVADRTKQGTINTGIVLNNESLPCTVPCCSCFGWDLIEDENKKELMRQNLTDKPPLQSIARRYIGYYKRRIKKKLKQR